MRKLLITLTLIISTALTGSAQQEPTVERKLVYASRPFFVPHWYVKAQAGAAYDIGEAKFSQLFFHFLSTVKQDLPSVAFRTHGEVYPDGSSSILQDQLIEVEFLIRFLPFYTHFQEKMTIFAPCSNL